MEYQIQQLFERLQRLEQVTYAMWCELYDEVLDIRTEVDFIVIAQKIRAKEGAQDDR